MGRGFRLFLAVVGFCLVLQEVPAEPLKGSSQQSPAEVPLGGAAILSRGAGGVVLAQSKNRSATAQRPLSDGHFAQRHLLPGHAGGNDQTRPRHALADGRLSNRFFLVG